MNADEALPVLTPPPVMGLYDAPMWGSINARKMRLQKCCSCASFLYPPGPTCGECLSMQYEWTAIKGVGEIWSWVVFHRSYLLAYPAPYNVIAVKLEEGPMLISNLDGELPAGSWIGCRVQLTYVTMPDGVVLPRFRLVKE